MDENHRQSAGGQRFPFIFAFFLANYRLIWPPNLDAIALPPSHQQNTLMPQEPLFAPEAAAVAGELGAAAAADDAVAGHDDGDWVTAAGGANRAHGFGVVDGDWNAVQVEDVVGLGGGRRELR